MKSQATKQGNLPQHHCCRHWGDDLCHGRSSEMQKVIQIAEIHFWPKKISTKNGPKMTKIDPKRPKMAQK